MVYYVAVVESGELRDRVMAVNGGLPHFHVLDLWFGGSGRAHERVKIMSSLSEKTVP